MTDNYKFEKLSCRVNVCTSKAHKFGTDAFLLSYFADPKDGDSIADFGTGCGIIPLILESKNYKFKKIYAIDIQQKAIEQFELSIKSSNLSKDRFIPIKADIKNIKDNIKNSSIDLVICNPPYKATNTGILNKDIAHQIANHEILCDIEDVCRSASYILKFRGRLAICQRPERLPDIMTSMRNNNIEPKRLRLVSNNPGQKPWLLLIEGLKGGKPFLTIDKNLYTRTLKGDYSDEMKNIYEYEK